MTELTNDSKRKRGIQASPVKLRKALVEAGIKSQAELATKIADMEGLDNPPRGLVNKIFRGQPVDVVSLERVARALNTESWRLYLNGEESETNPVLTEPPQKSVQATPNSQLFLGSKRILMPVTGMVFIGLLFGLLVLFNDGTEELTYPSPFPVWEGINPSLNKFSLIVAPSSYANVSLAQSINAVAKADYTVGSDIALALLIEKKPYEITQQYDTDLVISIRQETSGRHIGLIFSLFANENERVIWTEHQLRSTIDQQSEDIGQRVLMAMEHVLGINELATGLSFPPERAMWEYIQGLNYLDKSFSGDQTKEAQAYFYAAIRQYPDFAEANAGLCEALAHESWQGEVVEELAEAKSYCDKALFLTPDSIDVKNSNAWLMLATGQYESAIEQLKRNLDLSPNHVETLRMLAQAEVLSYPQTGDRESLFRAKNHSIQAIELTPSFWKPHYSLALTEFYLGNVAEAISALEDVVVREPFIPAYSSLANLYLCQERFEEAEVSYTSIINSYPNSYLGYEMLGTYYYLTGNASGAVENLETAIEKVEKEANLSVMWIVLADSYYLAGNTQEAELNYEKGIEVIQNDILLGVDTIVQHMVLERVVLRLKNINPDKFSDIEVPENDLESIDEGSLGLSGNTALAFLYYLRNDLVNAQLAYAKAVDACAVYGYHPELKSLLEEDAKKLTTNNGL